MQFFWAVTVLCVSEQVKLKAGFTVDIDHWKYAEGKWGIVTSFSNTLNINSMKLMYANNVAQVLSGG